MESGANTLEKKERRGKDADMRVPPVSERRRGTRSSAEQGERGGTHALLGRVTGPSQGKKGGRKRGGARCGPGKEWAGVGKLGRAGKGSAGPSGQNEWGKRRKVLLFFFSIFLSFIPKPFQVPFKNQF
jgi:hypothetical protein